MAEDIDLGKISLTPKGVWNDSVEVEFNDVWSWDGKKYLALQSSKGVIPQEDNIFYCTNMDRIIRRQTKPVDIIFLRNNPF